MDPILAEEKECVCLCVWVSAWWFRVIQSFLYTHTHRRTHALAVAALVKLSLPHRRNSLPMSAELSEHQTTHKVQTVTNKSFAHVSFNFKSPEKPKRQTIRKSRLSEVFSLKRGQFSGSSWVEAWMLFVSWWPKTTESYHTICVDIQYMDIFN